VNARHGVVKGEPGAPGFRDMREVFVDEDLPDVRECITARPGPIPGLAKECKEMSDVDDWVGGGGEIEIDESDAIAVDQHVLWFEIAMDK
jgi:hypothetical protein